MVVMLSFPIIEAMFIKSSSNENKKVKLECCKSFHPEMQVASSASSDKSSEQGEDDIWKAWWRENLNNQGKYQDFSTPFFIT